MAIHGCVTQSLLLVDIVAAGLCQIVLLKAVFVLYVYELWHVCATFAACPVVIVASGALSGICNHLSLSNLTDLLSCTVSFKT